MNRDRLVGAQSVCQNHEELMVGQNHDELRAQQNCEELRVEWKDASWASPSHAHP